MVECWAGNDAEEYKQGLERTLALPDIGGVAKVLVQFDGGFDGVAQGGDAIPTPAGQGGEVGIRVCGGGGFLHGHGCWRKG